MRRSGQQRRRHHRRDACAAKQTSCRLFAVIPQPSSVPSGFLPPKTKRPHETRWGSRQRPFSRRARPSAAREGSLAYGFFSRSQWRDRGRFARPSPLPLPANLQFESKPPCLPSQSAFDASLGGRPSAMSAPPRGAALFSDSSSSASASPPARANLPANPRAGRVRSGKCCGNASIRPAATSPFRRESPSSPSSAPRRNDS